MRSRGNKEKIVKSRALPYVFGGVLFYVLFGATVKINKQKINKKISEDIDDGCNSDIIKGKLVILCCGRGNAL